MWVPDHFMPSADPGNGPGPTDAEMAPFLEGWMLHGQITVDASDNIIFTLEGTAPGPWMWGTLVELSDATMNLRAVQQVATNP